MRGVDWDRSVRSRERGPGEVCVRWVCSALSWFRAAQKQSLLSDHIFGVGIIIATDTIRNQSARGGESMPRVVMLMLV